MCERRGGNAFFLCACDSAMIHPVHVNQMDTVGSRFSYKAAIMLPLLLPAQNCVVCSSCPSKELCMHRTCRSTRIIDNTYARTSKTACQPSELTFRALELADFVSKIDGKAPQSLSSQLCFATSNHEGKSTVITTCHSSHPKLLSELLPVLLRVTGCVSFGLCWRWFAGWWMLLPFRKTVLDSKLPTCYWLMLWTLLACIECLLPCRQQIPCCLSVHSILTHADSCSHVSLIPNFSRHFCNPLFISFSLEIGSVIRYYESL